ncbi:RNA-directed DNA polymerase, eukaryota, reverse transcriptase zinc-binding domain protein, partial [Tanacetum coccineum]
MGGLRIGSLSAGNLGLLEKWCSRLWINILKAGQKINDIGVPFINSFKRKFISGTSTRIWKDVWFRPQSLDQIYPREMEELENFDSVTMGLSLQDEVDGWTWSLDTSGSFSVSILRSCIDSLDLSRSDPANLRNELIPKKVNVFFWRLIRNCLPTKTNLVDKDIDLHTVLCSFCDDYSRSHDLLKLSGSVVLASVFTKTFDAVIRITSWVIWKHRNEKIFKNKDVS